MGIVYVRTSSKKPKRKVTKAELEAEAAFAKMQAKWDKAPKFCSKPLVKTVPRRPTVEELLAEPPKRSPGKLDSGSTAPVKQGTYTGSAMLGVATMHKSNQVPVFSKEDAVDISKMRRG